MTTMTKNTKASNSAIVLTDLAQEINQHEKSRRACEVKGIMHAIRMGELLIEAKKVAPHGTFRAWVEDNTSVSLRMAQMYMRIAGDRRIVDMVAHEYETVSHLTITQAVKLAQQHKAVETLVKEIKVIWKRVQADQREVANGLTEVHKSFEGDNVTDVLAAVVRAELDLTQLDGRVAAVVQQGLDKDRHQRFQHIGDVRIALERTLTHPEPSAVEFSGRGRWTTSAGAMVALVSAVVTVSVS